MWQIYALVALLVIQTFRLMREHGRSIRLAEKEAFAQLDLLGAKVVCVIRGEELRRLRAVLRQTHINYCTADWTDRGLHAPECLLDEIDDEQSPAGAKEVPRA